MNSCPYCVLGVSRNASAEGIRKAYLKGAFQHHPDRNAGSSSAEAKFKENAEAFNAIKNRTVRFLCKNHVYLDGSTTTKRRATFTVYGDAYEDEDVVCQRAQKAWDAAMAEYDKIIEERREKVKEIVKLIWNYRSMLLEYEINYLIQVADYCLDPKVMWRPFQVKQLESLLENVQRRSVKKSSLVDDSGGA